MNTPSQHIIIAFRGDARRKAFAQVPNVVTLDKTVGANAYRLYALLVSYAMQAEGSIVSQPAIADDLGCTDRSVRNWLAELENRGLITVHQRGMMQPNIYVIEDAYALYDAEKPKTKPQNGKQSSSEPSFRSGAEPGFQSRRNGGSAHGGTGVPTLKELSPNNSGEKQEGVASLAEKIGYMPPDFITEPGKSAVESALEWLRKRELK